MVVNKVEPMLGLQSCQKLNLLNRLNWCIVTQKENPLDEYKDMFKGIEIIHKNHIENDKNVNPVIHSPRKVSLALLEPNVIPNVKVNL